jgi:hypothetical protein
MDLTAVMGVTAVMGAKGATAGIGLANIGGLDVNLAPGVAGTAVVVAVAAMAALAVMGAMGAAFTYSLQKQCSIFARVVSLTMYQVG